MVALHHRTDTHSQPASAGVFLPLVLRVDYATIKLVHQGAVALSLAGFVARGLGSLAAAPWVASRPARTLPHVVDTVLLASALTLAWMARLDPASTPWLAAKVLGLIVYIMLGSLALRAGRPRKLRAVAGALALLVFAWIVSVAILKSPYGFFAMALQ
jgi:uncharacterized membrane protein SirB2